jgi:hypothetical protein
LYRSRKSLLQMNYMAFSAMGSSVIYETSSCDHRVANVLQESEI